MPGSPEVDTTAYAAALLAGARTGFLQLQERLAAGRIYFYGLRASATDSTVEPCVKTEEALDVEADRLRAALLRRGREATPSEVRLALRYDTPGDDLCARPAAIPTLALANRLLAGLGALRGGERPPHPASALPAGGGVAAALGEAPRRVLRALDAEGLFGVGGARRAVVLDLCWAEGAMPDALIHLDNPPPDQPAPLNPPDVHGAYLEALAEGRALRRRLFG